MIKKLFILFTILSMLLLVGCGREELAKEDILFCNGGNYKITDSFDDVSKIKIEVMDNGNCLTTTKMNQETEVLGNVVVGIQNVFYKGCIENKMDIMLREEIGFECIGKETEYFEGYTVCSEWGNPKKTYKEAWDELADNNKYRYIKKAIFDSILVECADEKYIYD